MKGQPVYGCITLHNGIWKKIKRKRIPQIKIRQIVELNDKIMINSNIPNIRDKKMISKHPRLTFFRMSGCVKDTVKIISFHAMRMRTVW